MNPLYNQLMQGRGVTPNQNGGMALSPQAQQFAAFAQNFRQMTNNMNPRQFAQQLLNSGQLNQAQINAFNLSPLMRFVRNDIYENGNRYRQFWRLVVYEIKVRGFNNETD